MEKKTDDENDKKLESNLLELFKEFNKNRIDYNERKWETIKFFESIFTALIVASIGGFISAIHFKVLNNVFVLIGLLLLPVCSCISLIFGILNLKRESKLLFIEEASMFKILKLISLPDKIHVDKRWIPGDEFFLPLKYRDYKYGLNPNKINENLDFEKWLDLRINKHSFFYIINNLFVYEIFISILLIIVIIFYYNFAI